MLQGEAAMRSRQAEVPKSAKKILSKGLNKPSKALAVAVECSTGK